MRNNVAEMTDLRSVRNALRLMIELADAEDPLAVTEVARRLDIAPSTAYRLLTTLVTHGFAVKIPAVRRYWAGPALATLGRRSLLHEVRLREAGRPVLERLAAHTGETTHLAVLDGRDAIGIDHVESWQPVAVRHPVGSRLPAHATAVGQALVAHLSEVTRALVAAGLTRHTRHTITEAGAFERTLEEIRRLGYAVNLRQWHPDTAGVAAAVLDGSGAPIAALGISGPASRIGRRAMLDARGALAREGAREIRSRLARPSLARHVWPDDPPAPAGDRS